MMDRPHLTTSQTAEHLQCSTDSVLELIGSGKLIAVNISAGRRASWRIPHANLLAFEASAHSDHATVGE